MATLPPLDSPPLIRLELVQSSGADPSLMNRLWVSYSGGPPNSTDLNSFLAHVNGEWDDYITPLQDGQTSLVEIVGTDMATTSGVQTVNSTVRNGTRSGTALDAAACLVVSHTITRRYRGGKPRTYLRAGVDGDRADNRTWGGSFLAEADAAWGNFIAGILGQSYGSFSTVDVRSVSYYDGGTWESYGTPTKYRRVPTLRTTPLEDLVVNHVARPTIGIQRRRI